MKVRLYRVNELIETMWMSGEQLYEYVKYKLPSDSDFV